jgi:hypothetical protein
MSRFIVQFLSGVCLRQNGDCLDFDFEDGVSQLLDLHKGICRRIRAHVLALTAATSGLRNSGTLVTNVVIFAT